MFFFIVNDTCDMLCFPYQFGTKLHCSGPIWSRVLRQRAKMLVHNLTSMLPRDIGQQLPQQVFAFFKKYCDVSFQSLFFKRSSLKKRTTEIQEMGQEYLFKLFVITYRKSIRTKLLSLESVKMLGDCSPLRVNPGFGVCWTCTQSS